MINPQTIVPLFLPVLDLIFVPIGKKEGRRFKSCLEKILYQSRSLKKFHAQN